MRMREEGGGLIWAIIYLAHRAGIMRSGQRRNRENGFATLRRGSCAQRFYKHRAPLEPKELFFLYAKEGFAQIINLAIRVIAPQR